MKIIADDKIPYLKGVLEKFAHVEYVSGSKISADIVKDADVLIIRTRTNCSAGLLKNSAVSFIASATIGHDHIDQRYCESNGITWTNAPGCNAESVNQYVTAAILEWTAEKGEHLSGKTIGIIGVGNVGSKVARTAALLGMRVLQNDPPRARNEGKKGFCTLGEIIREADIITLHVPLNRTGADKTYNLLNLSLLEKTAKHPLIINTCRGEVTNTSDLITALENGVIRDCIIDCWENEPDINAELLNKAFITTPHIAGYSRDGKANGTAQSVQALSKHFGLPLNNWQPDQIEPPMIKDIYLNGKELSRREVITNAVLSTYNIRQDDENLRRNIMDFEKLRGNYPVRREFTSFTVILMNIPKETTQILTELGFRI